MEELHGSELDRWIDLIKLKISGEEHSLKELDKEWADAHQMDGEINMEDTLSITAKRAIIQTKLTQLMWFRNILKNIKEN
jgi:hypothetical protein